MLKIVYTPSFVRQYEKLAPDLQEDAREKIALFRSNPHHSSLKTHKLKGHLRKYWSFRVNYAYRIIFEYDTKNVVALLGIGTHSIYR